MEFSERDFVKVDFDLYASGKLAETTDEEKGKAEGLEREKYGPVSIILGEGFILKALDDEILKGNQEGELDLSPQEAYGERNKDFIKTYPISVFKGQNVNPVVGRIYDFNGMYGKIKSNSGGRVMVDFNNPLAGKDIYISYKVVEKLEDISSKVEVIFENILKLPSHLYEVKTEESKLIVKIPKEIENHSQAIKETLENKVPGIEEYELVIESFKNN